MKYTVNIHTTQFDNGSSEHSLSIVWQQDLEEEIPTYRKSVNTRARLYLLINFTVNTEICNPTESERDRTEGIIDALRSRNVCRFDDRSVRVVSRALSVQITPNRMQGTGGTLTSLKSKAASSPPQPRLRKNLDRLWFVGSFRDIIVKRDSITNDGFVPIACIF